MSTFEEFRPEFEISSKVETVARYGFEGIYPLQDSSVATRQPWMSQALWRGKDALLLLLYSRYRS